MLSLCVLNLACVYKYIPVCVKEISINVLIPSFDKIKHPGPHLWVQGSSRVSAAFS